MNYDNMLSLKNRLARFDAGTWLDVGVGRGDFLKFAASSFHSWQRIAGIDIDYDSLITASHDLSGLPAILVLGSALTMPFTNGYFDTVTMSNTLHHIENLPLLIEETCRVSRKKGYIIINEMLNESFSEIHESYLLYHKFISDIDNQQGKFHRETYSLKELLNLVKSPKLQLLDYFIHAEEEGNTMNTTEIEALSDRIRKKVSLLKGSDYYYFYENKAAEIINRFVRTGIHRPRHAVFVMEVI